MRNNDPEIAVSDADERLSILMEKYGHDVLNAALELATEWGENFRKPIADRLLERFPEVARADVEEIERAAREAEYFIYSLGERELAGEINESDITRLAIERFPWLKPEHAARLKNIAMYYARR